jgi:hypothetical protein
VLQRAGTTFARWHGVHKRPFGRPTLHRKSGRQISQAIETFLDLHYLTGQPLASIERTLTTLRQLGWSENDMFRVERIVRKVLALHSSARSQSNGKVAT